MDKKEAYEAARAALLSYNSDIKSDDVTVRAFYLNWDEEFEGWTATIIFVLEDIRKAEDMDFVDTHCSQSGAALEEICAFTYCTFRSEQQYIDEFSSHSWVAELIREDYTQHRHQWLGNPSLSEIADDIKKLKINRL